MNFEVIVSKGNPRVYKNRDLSLIDVDDEKIAIAHQNYNRDIYFNQFSSRYSLFRARSQNQIGGYQELVRLGELASAMGKRIC